MLHSPFGAFKGLNADVLGNVGFCMVKANHHVRLGALGPTTVIALGTFSGTFSAGRFGELNSVQECGQEFIWNFIRPWVSREVTEILLPGENVCIGVEEKIRCECPDLLPLDLEGRSWHTILRAWAGDVGWVGQPPERGRART
jgi:hypothetical protein